MKVSVAWIAVGMIVGIILFFTREGFSIYEQFKNTEGFQTQDEQENLDIHITSCPADTVSYVDGGGRTVCCDGTVADGKCSGAKVCSLSEPISGLPTCSIWLDAYLENKGAQRCPTTMPHYFENKAANTSGCTGGDRNTKGTAPLSAKFCNLYVSEEDSLLKIDSCENQKMLENAKCLSVQTTKSLSDRGDIPPLISCIGMDNSLTPLNCIDDASAARTYDYTTKKYNPSLANWREQSVGWGALWKISFCSAVQKVKIDKTLSLSDLESYKLF